MELDRTSLQRRVDEMHRREHDHLGRSTTYEMPEMPIGLPNADA
jgi:hypothetical protein